MIRFRNPACDLQGMLTTFKAVYRQLHGQETFTLTDMTQAIIAANRMSSSGYTGQKALELGSSEERRRDKTYNNAKMLSEWFRLLGWMTAVSTTVLEFRFTWLGMHAAALTGDPTAFLEECLLGISNPNAVLRVKYTEPVRFFRCLLRTMLHMDGRLCRDEIILGPMCADDRSEASFSAMLDRLRALRGGDAALETAFDVLCKELNMKEISVRNCTRFPISALRGCGWAEECRDDRTYPGSSIKFFRLTEYGRARAQELERVCDLRLQDWLEQPQETQDALIRQGFYQMMARAGFDTAEYDASAQAEADAARCQALLNGRTLYFSPYQTVDSAQADAALDVQQAAAEPEEWFDLFALMDAPAAAPAALLQRNAPADTVPTLTVRFSETLRTAHWDDGAVSLAGEISALLVVGKTPTDIAAVLSEQYAESNQTVFYPLVASLFQILGYPCSASRKGDNAERWDAIVTDPEESIPIEIKSPMEEQHLSMKAVRQALENKIVLLSRKTHPTTMACSTLAVGFLPPNARADVAALIADMKTTYGISVAVIDFGSLVTLAAQTLRSGAAPEASMIRRWEGIVHADHITAAEPEHGAPTP